MYSLTLNPWRWVALATGRSTTVMTGRSGRVAAGRAAVFLAVILRDAPCRFGLGTGLCLAPRAARDDETLRRLPAEAFLEVLFFKRRAFSATAFAWNSRSLTPFPDKFPKK